MQEYIIDFPKQLKEASALVGGIKLGSRTEPIHNIIISGLGGSGFLADCLFDLCNDTIGVPIVANKGYSLPKFCDKNTLLILVSYSGNTEETVSCFHEAMSKGLKPICVSSGGKLKDLALNAGMDYIAMPTGFPPRASLAFGAANLFYVLNHFGVLLFDVASSFSKLGTFLDSKQSDIKATSKHYAVHFKNKILVAYAEDRIDGIALRLKQQINENSKAFCWYNIIPELNHNELVGWKQQHHAIGTLFVRTSFENVRNKHRFDFLKPLLENYVDEVLEIQAEGNSFFEQYFFLIHWCDWLSYYLALEHEQDPTEVRVIDNLKAYLNNIN